MLRDRRELMKTLSAAIGLGAFSVVSSGDSHADKPRNMADWMDRWAGERARDPSGGLFVYRFKDPTWALLKPIAWKPNPGQSQKEVNVPASFVTDFASIPPAFYSLLRPDGEYSYAAVFHDYLYWTQERPREEADEIFRLAMLDFNIDRSTVTAIYRAVRAFGSSAWQKNVKLRNAGERRVIQRFPDDPRMTWDEWKRKSGVFG